MSIKKENEFKESVQRLQASDREFLRLLGELNKIMEEKDDNNVNNNH